MLSYKTKYQMSKVLEFAKKQRTLST